MSCEYDADENDACIGSWRRARKAHECCACSETIERGHRYHYTWSLYDCNSSTFKHCARCWAIFQAVGNRVWPHGEAVAYDLDCGHSWDENFGDAPPDEVASLAFLTQQEAQQLAGLTHWPKG